MKQYLDFKEIEKEVRAGAPPMVYKFRTWEDENHQRMITHNEAWMSHPFGLNDPYDVRPPYRFNLDAVKWDQVRATIRKAGQAEEPHLTPAELEVEVEKRYQSFVADPVSYLGLNRQGYVMQKERYDCYGIFSTCMSAENEAMWAHYGNNHQGFAVGFDTVELARAMYCSMGKVDYSDEPMTFTIMGDNTGLMGKEVFTKSTKWIQEEEFRFATVVIGPLRQRATIFPPEAVREIVFGMDTTEEVQQRIRSLAEKQFPGVKFLRVARRYDSYGLVKMPI